MADVFLSYSREDQATARHFAAGLECAGFSVWWDQSLSPGEAFDQVTEQALELAKAVVVLWSQASVSSRWVRAEATQAHADHRLVPAMIEPCKRPIMFELTHTADLSAWGGDTDDPVWQAFAAGVRRLVDRGASGGVAPIPAAVPATRPAIAAAKPGKPAAARAARSPPLPGREGWISRRAWLTGGAGAAALGLGAGALATSYLRRDSAPLSSFQRLTFRRGMIRTARFAPDYQTVYYGALWDGDVCRVYMVRPESPESSALPLPPGMPLAISSSGELALALGTHYRGIMTYGTLARVPLVGGAPRELEENVKYADWSPDGDDLVVVRAAENGDRIKFAVSTVVIEPRTAGGGFSFVRFSPDGRSVAAFALASAQYLAGHVVIFDRSGKKTLESSREYFNVFGLAWHGEEVWFTAADELPLFRNAVYAMNRSGTVRIVARVPSNISLHDIAPNGRVLFARTDDRGGIAVRAPGEAAERDLSWLDAGTLADIAPDGRKILFTENGVGGGPRQSVFLRATDGSPAVRLGDGSALALSHDGRWALVKPDGNTAHIDVIPTGPGEPRRLERPGLTLLDARWLPDGRTVVASAQPGDSLPRLYALEIEGSAARPITPEGVTVRSWALSPDGAMVALSTDSGVALFPIADGEAQSVPRSNARWHVVGWIEAGLLISEDPAAGGAVSLVDPVAGSAEVWTSIQPPDPSGVMFFDLRSLVTTPDGSGYGYTWHRALSDLYVAEGWSQNA